MIKKIVTIFLILQLSACTTGEWHKQGATEQEFHQTNYICLKEAQQPTANGHAAMMPTTKEKNNSSAYHTPAFTSDYSSGMITNEELFNACMNAHGFSWVVTNKVQ